MVDNLEQETNMYIVFRESEEDNDPGRTSTRSGTFADARASLEFLSDFPERRRTEFVELVG